MDNVPPGGSGGKPGRIGRPSLKWRAAIGLVVGALGVAAIGGCLSTSASKSTSQNYLGNGSIDFDLYIGANLGAPTSRIHDPILSGCVQGSTYTIGNPQSRTAALEISLNPKPDTFPHTFQVKSSPLSVSLRMNGDPFSSAAADSGHLTITSATTGSFDFKFTVALNTSGKYQTTPVEVQGTFNFSSGCP